MERTYNRKLVQTEEDVIYTAKEFLDAVKDGEIWDDCGSGYWMKDGFESNDEVFNTPQLDATHVAWYNK